MIRPILAVLLLSVTSLVVGCIGRDSKDNNPERAQTDFAGTLLRHPDAHTTNSFFTGNYHLRTDDGTLHEISESQDVTSETFDRFHEKRVRVFGQFQPGEQWDGSDGTAGPSLEPGESWKRADSFRVDRIEALDGEGHANNPPVRSSQH